jgi:hypothetical protein
LSVDITLNINARTHAHRANDDGQSGTLEMWTVNTKTYELEEWPKEKHGIFYRY